MEFPGATDAEEDVALSLGFSNLAGEFLILATEWAGQGFNLPITTTFDSFSSATTNGDYQDDCCPGTLDISDGFDFSIDLQPGLDTCDVVLTGLLTSASFSIAIGTWPAGGVYPFIEFSQHADSLVFLDVTDLELTLGG